MNKAKKFIAVNVKYIPAATAIILFVLAYIVGAIIYGDRGFLSMRTFTSIFTDNAYLGVSAIGMTFVIISGGIDLSVSSIAALTTMIIAYGTETLGINPIICILFAVLIGTLFGYLMGCLIQIFSVPPFIATLAGMFLARGLCFVISIQSITMNNPILRAIGQWKIDLPGNSYINFSVFVFAIFLIVGILIMHKTRFGRNIYAIGGNEQSAKLMGLPVKQTRIAIYTFNGFCSSIAGLLFGLYTFSGYGRHLVGVEMDIISSTVIGGTLLSGGVGYPLGSLFGVMIQGIILKFISFNGSLSSWWTRIVVGVLLFIFIVIQRIVIMIASKNKQNT